MSLTNIGSIKDCKGSPSVHWDILRCSYSMDIVRNGGRFGTLECHQVGVKDGIATPENEAGSLRNG